MEERRRVRLFGCLFPFDDRSILHESQASTRCLFQQTRHIPSQRSHHPSHISQLSTPIVSTMARRRHGCLAPAQQVAHIRAHSRASPAAATTTAAATSSPDFCTPVADDVRNQLHDAVANQAAEPVVLRVKDVLQHARNHVVGDTQRDKELHRPARLGANGEVLLVADRVAAHLGQQLVDGEDEAVERRVVRDALDLAADDLVGHGRRRCAGLQRGVLQGDLLMRLLDEIAPGA